MCKQIFIAACFALAPALAMAQPAPGGAEGGASTVVTRMMAFDKNADGKVSRDEMTDQRLQDLFDRADTNKDGFATREELTALSAAIDAEFGQAGGGGRGGPGRGGPGGPGGPGGRGPGGPGGRGGGPAPGQIIPPFARDMLNLTPEQNKQLDDLQHDVDERLAKILTPEQKSLLEQNQGRGRGRGGPPPGGPP